ncbi:MAG TPA: hypothetical protein VLL04_11475, partial [Rhizomicrobium sp.]|nr:hypothetical protein [Rhizomicrobium sp.]
AADALAFAAQDRLRLASRSLLAVTALLGLHWCVAVDAALLLDPRYDAEAWLAAHIKPGDAIETYGQNCFLPRFPQQALVTRIGQTDLRLRNPLRAAAMEIMQADQDALRRHRSRSKIQMVSSRLSWTCTTGHSPR